MNAERNFILRYHDLLSLTIHWCTLLFHLLLLRTNDIQLVVLQQITNVPIILLKLD